MEPAPTCAHKRLTPAGRRAGQKRTRNNTRGRPGPTALFSLSLTPRDTARVVLSRDRRGAANPRPLWGAATRDGEDRAASAIQREQRSAPHTRRAMATYRSDQSHGACGRHSPPARARHARPIMCTVSARRRLGPTAQEELTLVVGPLDHHVQHGDTGDSVAERLGALELRQQRHLDVDLVN